LISSARHRHWPTLSTNSPYTPVIYLLMALLYHSDLDGRPAMLSYRIRT
jgi:hypothetical protein